MVPRDSTVVDGVSGINADTRIATFRPADDEQPALQIVETVAAVTGTDPREMQPLSEVINPDAINQLYRGVDDRQSGLQTTFRFEGCTVTLHASGRIRVSVPDE